MKQYIGVKLIKAVPQEREGQAGYTVIYPDGYESWSPKEVFDAAYTPIEDSCTIEPEDILNEVQTLIQYRARH